jgi:hypothetical protein
MSLFRLLVIVANVAYMQSVRKAAIDDPIISRYMHFLDVDEMIPAEYRAASEVRKDHKYACGPSHCPASAARF